MGLSSDHGDGCCGSSGVDAVIAGSAFVHFTAIIGGTAEWVGKDTTLAAHVGERSIVRPYVTVDAGVDRATVIGDDVLLMTRVHVGHDAHVGDGCQIAPGAVICGCVTIGENVKIGANATIRPHIVVGDGARIGMGAVVTKDIPAGEVWAGNPARKLNR